MYHLVPGDEGRRGADTPRERTSYVGHRTAQANIDDIPATADEDTRDLRVIVSVGNHCGYVRRLMSVLMYIPVHCWF